MTGKAKKAPMDHSKKIPCKGTSPTPVGFDQVTSRAQTKAPAHSLARRKAGYEQGTF